MIKALFFVNSLGNGGAERVCVNMARYIIEAGGQADFITLFECESYSDFVVSNHLCLGIDSSTSRLNIIGEIVKKKSKINRFIADKEKDYKYSLITAHLPLSHICATISMKRKDILYVQHISLISEGKHFNLYKYFYKNKTNICVSEGLKREFVKDMKAVQEKCFTIYNPVNVKEIAVKSVEQSYFNEPYILSVGRLCSQKRFDRAIDIFYKGGFYKNYYFVILGQGELKNQLEMKAKEYGISNRVILYGWSDNVYAWMKNSELLLQTSDREAFPMVLLEALASGTKVVAGNCHYGADEIMTEELSHYIAQYDNIDDYIDKINKALKYYPEKEEYKILEECSDKAVVKRYIEVYREMEKRC